MKMNEDVFFKSYKTPRIEKSKNKPVFNVEKKLKEQFVKVNKDNIPLIKKHKKKIQNQTYNSGYDINHINSMMIEKFEERYNSLNEYKDRLKKYECVVTNSTNISDKFNASKKINELKKEINEIETCAEMGYYLLKTHKLLNEYNSLLQHPVNIDFMNTKSQLTLNSKKDEIIHDFNVIVNSYPFMTVDIKVNTDVIKNKKNCYNCKSELTKQNGNLVCTTCGECEDIFDNSSSFTDVSRVNMSSRYKYDKRIHFRDTLNNFQGKQNKTIHDDIYVVIKDEMNKHGITKDKLTKNHVYIFLKETGFSKYYEDITLIYSKITGKKPPDISHLENELMEMFDKVIKVYVKIKPPTRKSFLNCQFILYQFLKKLKYPCKETDFSFLKSRDKLIEHELIYGQICDVLSWNATPV